MQGRRPTGSARVGSNKGDGGRDEMSHDPATPTVLRSPVSMMTSLRIRVLASLDDARDSVATKPAMAVALVVVLIVGVGSLAFTGRRGSSETLESTLPRAVVIGAGDGAVASTDVAPSDTSRGPDVDTSVLVHVAGSVVRPGVYVLGPDDRVQDLISAAGGLLPEADPARLNLAARVVDGTRLHVPRIGEDAQPTPIPTVGGSPSGDVEDGQPSIVDLNRASIEELERLPGVGPSIAAAIVEHRDRLGAFGTVNELLDVRGIGPAKLSAMADLVVVR